MPAPPDFTDTSYRVMVKIFPEGKMEDFVGGYFRITGNAHATKAEIQGHGVLVKDFHRLPFFVAGGKGKRESIA